MFSSIFSYYYKLSDIICKKLENIILMRYWLLITIFCCTILSILWNYPDYRKIETLRMSWGRQAIEWKNNHPLQAINVDDFIGDNTPDGMYTHLPKRTFRITMPIISYLTQGGVRICIALNTLSGILFFLLCFKFMKNEKQDNVLGILLCICFSITYVSGHTFNDLDYLLYDGFAYFCLVAALCFDIPILIFIFLVLASFTDERGLINSSFVILYWRIKNQGFENISLKNFFYLDRQCIAVIASWFFYIIVRAYLTINLNLKTDTTQIFDFITLKTTITDHVPATMFYVFAGFWLVILLAFTILWIKKHYFFMFLYLFCYGLSLFVAINVYDFDRSFAYSIPSIFIALHILGHETSAIYKKRLFILVFMISICFIKTNRTVLSAFF
jgi:hypothetical protein